jgi:pseudo-rSAM protein
MKLATDYWFTIEPYVYISIVNEYALLYNTLDGITIESDKKEVVDILQEVLQEENCGVVLLTPEQYQQKNITAFIRELRENYMGDIINVALSKGRPVQLLPYVNFSHKRKKKYSFSSLENMLQTLYDISIHVDYITDITKLIPFLQSMPEGLTFNIIGNLEEVTNGNELLSFLDRHPSPKNILCSYTNIISLEPDFKHNFSYKVYVHFPVDRKQWDASVQLLLNQSLPFEFIFDVTSFQDCKEAEQIIEQYQIEKYHLNPVYTGENISFFKENVFLTKEDILSTSTSTSMSIKDFFIKQFINIHDFGKINIMPNGDAYANVNHPALGNIHTHSIHEIIQKEIDGGKSWLRIRNQAPCNTCIYQWLCPPPSDHEIAIGRPNLCHVNSESF